MIAVPRTEATRFASAVAFTIAVLAWGPHAKAQDKPAAPQASVSDSDDWSPIDNSDVQQPPADKELAVVAPKPKIERTAKPGWHPEKMTMFTEVRYDDLDLNTAHGAQALRARVHSAAGDVCEQLAAAYPVYELHLTSCKKTAEKNARLRADRIIDGKADIQKP